MPSSGAEILRGRRSFMILGLVMAFGLAIGIAYVLENEPRKFHSSDGTVIRLERYTFQSGSVRYDLPNRPLLRVCAKVFPNTMLDKLQDKLYWLHSEDTTFVGPASFRGEPFLSAAFSAQRPNDSRRSKSGTGTRMVMLDDLGQVYDAALNNMNGGVFTAEAFPRRGKTLKLRLLDGQPNAVVAEFGIPNPCPGPHPLWRANPLPVVVGNKALEITLEKFTADARRLRTECAFRVRENGQDSVDWLPEAFEILDATGNHWSPIVKPPRKEASGRIIGWFLGALWPGESAWKLRVEFRSENTTHTNQSSCVFEFLAKPDQVGDIPSTSTTGDQAR